MRTLKRVLITGATGMIGATLARLLLQENIEVVAVVRPGTKKIRNLPLSDPGLTVLAADLQNLASLSEIHRDGKRLSPDVDAVFHFGWDGAYGAARNDEALQERNVQSTLSAVSLAKALGAKVFVGAGSQAEYGPKEGTLSETTALNPVTEYGKAKGRAREQGLLLSKKLGIDFIWTRILSVYGPYDNSYTMVMSAVRSFLRGEHLAFTKGEQIWDYLYSEDAARCFHELAKNGRNGRTYVLGHGEGRALSEYIRDIRDAVAPGAKIGLGERDYYENQVMMLVADITALKEDTGYAPDTPFSDGIQKTAEWAKREGN